MTSWCPWALTWTSHGAIFPKKTATGSCSLKSNRRFLSTLASRRQKRGRALKQKLEPGYMGTFTSAKRHVFSTFANTHSAMMKKRVAQFMVSAECGTCHGKRLRPESLSVKFAGYDIAEISSLPLKRLHAVLEPFSRQASRKHAAHPEKAEVSAAHHVLNSQIA